MSYAVATWGGDNMVLVNEQGEVIDSSSPAAKREAELHLAQDVIYAWEGEDNRARLERGDKGFVVAALAQLDQATVTGG